MSCGVDPKVQLLKGWDNAAKDVLQKGAAAYQLACSAMVTCLLWDTE